MKNPHAIATDKAVVCSRFAARLREIRKQSNLSQEKLAAEAGLDRTYVSGCERGVRNISLANIVKLAAALGVQPSELLDNQ
ncbi:MAG: helix-turn-helix transcriptional regulator [Verrucomicrobiales bacterium]